MNAEGYAVAERSGSAWYQRIALANAAEYRGVRGEPEQALALLARWEAIEGDAGDRLTIQFLYTKSEILTRSGRDDEARAVCELAVERSRATEHDMGMTCDPVTGVAQIPCIERDVFGAVKTDTAASLAMKGDGIQKVSLDACVGMMRQTGLDMSHRYEETSLAGLAVNVPAC